MAAPEAYAHSELEVAPQQSPLPAKYKPYDAVPEYYEGPVDPRDERTICGLRTTTFFLALALLLVILAAGIGGGVGGTMAVNNAKK